LAFALAANNAFFLALAYKSACILALRFAFACALCGNAVLFLLMFNLLSLIALAPTAFEGFTIFGVVIGFFLLSAYNILLVFVGLTILVDFD
jgi:hypothetical protein